MGGRSFSVARSPPAGQRHEVSSTAPRPKRWSLTIDTGDSDSGVEQHGINAVQTVTSWLRVVLDAKDARRFGNPRAALRVNG